MDTERILSILKKHARLVVKDWKPYEESGIVQEFILVKINLEEDLNLEETRLMKGWLEENEK